MAGRKQHHIQQHLLRGFAIDPHTRPAQLWVYRKGANPFMCSTADYGAQRDFYGTPEDTMVDDTITTAENKQFDQLIDAVRGCENGSTVDARAAARFYQHLLFRSKNVRDVFSSATGQLMVRMRAEMLQKDRLLRFLIELYSRHPEPLLAKAEQQRGRPFGKVERAAVAAALKNNLPVLIPRFLDEAWPILEKAFAELVSRTPELVAAGHKKALRKSFANTEGKREVEMRQLQWRVYDVREILAGTMQLKTGAPFGGIE